MSHENCRGDEVGQQAWRDRTTLCENEDEVGQHYLGIRKSDKRSGTGCKNYIKNTV